MLSDMMSPGHVLADYVAERGRPIEVSTKRMRTVEPFRSVFGKVFTGAARPMQNRYSDWKDRRSDRKDVKAENKIMKHYSKAEI